MFPPKVRFALVFICAAVGIYSFTIGEVFPGIALFVVGGLLVYGHISYNRISLIYKHVISGDYGLAEAQLKKIDDAASLSKEQQAYYHFSKGMVAMNKTAFEDAERELNLALDFGLDTENDMAVANFYLAKIYHGQSSFVIAREFLEKAKKYKTHPNLETHIKQLDIVLNQARPEDN
jgi:hypothetical protein